jgi:hypothetical protein
MEITENSFSLRGVSGLVKVVSDSVFDPRSASGSYAEEAECDIIVESNGFRVNKVILLSMPAVLAFLHELRRLIDRGEGRASLSDPGEELSLAFISEKGHARVECSMNDSKEGKKNSVVVKYPIEPDYLAAFRRELMKNERPSSKVD